MSNYDPGQQPWGGQPQDPYGGPPQYPGGPAGGAGGYPPPNYPYGGGFG